MPRGGKRLGAGAPLKYGEPTKAMNLRVPHSLHKIVKEFISLAFKLKNTPEWEEWLKSWRIKG